MRFVAPAGTPISMRTYARGLGRGLLRPRVTQRFAADLARHSGRSAAWLLSTGRAAMVMTLRAMREACGDPRRREVIVPAYTCYSVPASIELAGLTPRLCDVDPLTLSPSLVHLERFDCSTVLAVVSANLYGMPNALGEIESFARSRGIFLLDDAAQALGASLDQRPAGGFGDAGLFSFDKGKNITSLDGGAIVSSHAELSRALNASYDAARTTAMVSAAFSAAKLAAYGFLLHPSRYGLIRNAPGLRLGQTRYDTDFPIERYSRLLAGFASVLFEDLADLTSTRRKNAEFLQAQLGGVPGIVLPSAVPGGSAAFTRQPIFIADPTLRPQALAALQAAGVGATTSYPAALCDVPQVVARLPQADRDMPGARWVAERILTLPTHPHCPRDLADTVGTILRRVTSGASRHPPGSQPGGPG